MYEFTVEDMQRDTPRWYWWPSLREAWRDAKRRGHPGVRRERSEDSEGSGDDGPSFSLSDASNADDDRRRGSEASSWGGLAVATAAASSDSGSSSSGSYDSGSSGSSDSGSSSSSSD